MTWYSKEAADIVPWRGKDAVDILNLDARRKLMSCWNSTSIVELGPVCHTRQLCGPENLPERVMLAIPNSATYSERRMSAKSTLTERLL